MAIGTLTRVAAHSKLGAPFLDEVTLVGDAAYPTTGTTGLKAALQAISLDQRVPLAIIQIDHTGYVLRYNPNDDTLIAMYGNYDAADGPLIDVPGPVNLSGSTFKFLIISK
jgi:hypothetical protein